MRTRIKITILFVAVILFLAPTALTVHAQPDGIGRGHARSFVEPIIIGHGFALKGDEYHILDVNAVKMSNASPGLIRSLLSQKKSPEDIRKEINDAQTGEMIIAHLRFAGQVYTLNITSYDNRSFAGDVLTLPPHGTDRSNFTPSAVGNISLSISKYEGDMISTGALIINGTNYNVLLTSPIRFFR